MHPREDASRDLGDVVVPPCCVPFCHLDAAEIH